MKSAYSYHGHNLCLERSGDRVELLTLLNPRSNPIYLYNLAHVLARLEAYQSAFASQRTNIFYAMKANHCRKLLAAIAARGAGVDVVSWGEAESALQAGFVPEKIVFSGVAKTEAELEAAVVRGILQVHVESASELKRLARIAEKSARVVRVVLRLNPDVAARTHTSIRTGSRADKFGVPASEWQQALQICQSTKWLSLRGISLHIGSQVTELDDFASAIKRALAEVQSLRSQGFPIECLDIGGGLAIDYSTQDETAELSRLVAYGQMVERLTLGQNLEILCEPGRFLVARAGVLLAQVQYIKQTDEKCFLILNSGMNHLLRPALYQAQHRLLPLKIHKDRTNKIYDVVGPICESTDVLAINYDLQEMREGEWLAIMDTGAYGAVIASSYNLQPLPEEVVF